MFVAIAIPALILLDTTSFAAAATEAPAVGMAKAAPCATVAALDVCVLIIVLATPAALSPIIAPACNPSFSPAKVFNNPKPASILLTFASLIAFFASKTAFSFSISSFPYFSCTAAISLARFVSNSSMSSPFCFFACIIAKYLSYIAFCSLCCSVSWLSAKLSNKAASSNIS
jgi:hypothetical protein